jgi:hypothetical protein
VPKEDRIVGGFGPLLGAIALAERLAGVRVRKAFDVHLVCDGTLKAAWTGHDDSVAIGGLWGGPVYVGDLMRGPSRRSEAINKGRRGYGGV